MLQIEIKLGLFYPAENFPFTYTMIFWNAYRDVYIYHEISIQ